jgi:hypothetical protein
MALMALIRSPASRNPVMAILEMSANFRPETHTGHEEKWSGMIHEY